MSQVETLQGSRLAVVTAIAGTVLIAAGAFWLSFTALADLARRSGIDAGQAWAWPLIVDGIIVVATVAVVALARSRAAWYPWMLLIAGAGLSVTANSIHAVLATDRAVPEVLAAAVAAVPPLVLLAITHLTVILTRYRHHPTPPATIFPTPTPTQVPLPHLSPEPGSRASRVDPPTSILPVPSRRGNPKIMLRRKAEQLRAEGWSNKRIARELGVHPSTVGRWAHAAPLTPQREDSHMSATPSTSAEQHPSRQNARTP